MVEIVDNKWRPFIKLTGTTGEEIYFDVNSRPLVVQGEKITTISTANMPTIFVQESAKDIIAAVDKLIEAEQDKKAEEARQYMEATMARVAETKKQLENN